MVEYQWGSFTGQTFNKMCLFYKGCSIVTVLADIILYLNNAALLSAPKEGAVLPHCVMLAGRSISGDVTFRVFSFFFWSLVA